MRARGASHTAATQSAPASATSTACGRGARRRASPSTDGRPIAGQADDCGGRADRRRAPGHAAHRRDRAQDQQRARAGGRARDHQRPPPARVAPTRRRHSQARQPAPEHERQQHARAGDGGRAPARGRVAGLGPEGVAAGVHARRVEQLQPRRGDRALDGNAHRAARDQVGVDVDQEAHAAAVGRQEPAERVGAPHDPLAHRLVVALAAAALEDAAHADAAAAVDGQVGELRRPEHAPHAGDPPELLLGDRDRAAVFERERVVDLDRDLEQRLLIEARRDLAPARDRGAVERRPAERAGRASRSRRHQQPAAGARQSRPCPGHGSHAVDSITARRWRRARPRSCARSARRRGSPRATADRTRGAGGC